MSEPEPTGPGGVLRAEREALGVSVREVAETLNLSMSVVEAIEDDDLERLPGPVFARGYVRAYARLLQLPAESLMAQYPDAARPTTMVQGAAEAPIWEWIRTRPGLVLGSGAGGAALLLLTLVLWAWPEPAAELEPTLADEAGAGGELAVANAANRAADTPVAAASPSPETVATPPPAPTPVPAADRPAQLVADPAAPSRSEDTGTRRITSAGDDLLAFSFSDDCWVEVRNSDGGNLYSDLSRADSRLRLTGQGPFRILLGYAPGVELQFNGEPVPLAPHTRNNVASLVLGH